MQTPNTEAHAGIDELASRYVDVDSLEWQPSPFEGVSAKILLLDENGGVRTMLVKMEPGATIPDHEHTGLEQSYILEGTLEDHDGVCGPGQYVWRPVRQPSCRDLAQRRVDAGDVRNPQHLSRRPGQGRNDGAIDGREGVGRSLTPRQEIRRRSGPVRKGPDKNSREGVGRSLTPRQEIRRRSGPVRKGPDKNRRANRWRLT